VGPSHADSVLRAALIRINVNGPQPVRFASRISGRFQGHDLLLRADTVVVVGRASERAIALADVDSVWVRRNVARGLAIVAGTICALGGAILGAALATDPDSGDASVAGAVLIGGTLAGATCAAGGWLIGDLIRAWRLEYVRPVDPST
jgi:hypothetical protein